MLQPVIEPAIRLPTPLLWIGMLALKIDEADALFGAEQAVDRQHRMNERPARVAVGTVAAQNQRRMQER